MLDEPKKIKIERFTDDRGDFTNISLDYFIPKRAYFISNSKKEVIRAYHGHKKEWKLFFVTKGVFTFKFIKIGEEEKLDKKIIEFTLSEKNPEIIICPPGWFNGFINRTEENGLIVFSSSTMEESKEDDFRIPFNKFDGWEVKNR
ncbi:MAG: WxcM-like domain-containing protein [Candidatus Pacearchaeota archaeon]